MPRQPFTEERVAAYALAHGGSLSSKDVIKERDNRYYWVQCGKGHQFRVGVNVLRRGSWCRICRWATQHHRIQKEYHFKAKSTWEAFSKIQYLPIKQSYTNLYFSSAKFPLRLQFSLDRQLLSLQHAFERVFALGIHVKPRSIMLLIFYLYSDVTLRKVCRTIGLGTDVSTRMLYHKLKLSKKAFSTYREDFQTHLDLEGTL